jgi:CRP-like cAMP-binding protein
MSVAANELVDFFRRQNFLRQFRRGHVIFSQGDPLGFVYMIERGMVKIYDIDAGGNERTLTIFAKDHIFPVSWLLKDAPAGHLYFYEAIIDTACYAVDADTVKTFIKHRPEVLVSLLDGLTKSYISVIGRVQNLEKSHIHERLEYVLYLLAMRLGTFNEGVAHIEAAITQEDIARLAGVTREAMSQEINASRAQRMYWREDGKTYIDTNQIDVMALPKIYPL